MILRFAAAILFMGIACAQPSFNAGVDSVVVEGAPAVMYAAWPLQSGTASALFRSADEGATWLPVYLTEPGLPQPPIRSLVVDPTNPAILLIATDPAHSGVWRSTDSGATWNAANTGLPGTDCNVQRLFLLRPSPSVIYAQTALSVYKTGDGGRTWDRQGALPAGISLFTVNPGDPNHMYATTAAGSLYHSADEGRSWQAMTPFTLLHGGSVGDTIVDLTTAPLSSRQVFVTVRGPWIWVDSGTGAGVQWSQDYGASWANIAPGEPYNIYLDPSGRSIAYYTDPEGGEVCKTTSFASELWTCVTVVRSSSVHLWISSTVPDTMYAATSNGIYKSTDAAATWRHVDGTVRPTLAKPVDPLNFTLATGTRGYRKLDVQTLEKNDWQLPFTASATAAWLSVDTPSGTTPATLQVSVSASGFAEGSYEGTIQLASTLAANSSVTVPVHLTVIPASSGGPAYDLSAFAGTGKYGFGGDGAAASSALLREPAALSLDASGTLYIADSGNHRVRKVTADGVIRTIAGTGTFGFSGDNGDAVAAQIWRPQGVAATGGKVYISDSFNDRLRVTDAAGTITTVLSRDTPINVRWPRGISVDGSGNLFIADFSGGRILKLTPPNSARAVATGLKSPSDVAVDSSGNLYIADTGTHRILRVDTAGKSTVLAGTGNDGFDGDGGPAASATLNAPESVAVGSDGQIYITDTGNHRIRVITSQGIIRTIAGTGTAGSTGAGGPAASAQLNRPSDIVVDSSGSLYVADKGNDRVVKLTLQAGSGPRISSGGIVNAASYTAATAPGSLFSIFGTELASAIAQAGSLPWPSTLAGASVTVGGRPAPLYYAGSTQINAQVPYETSFGTVPVVVTSEGIQSAPASLTVNAAAPGIFQTTAGRALAQNPDGSVNSAANPARVGSVIVVYLTGTGLLDNPIASGDAAPIGILSRPVLPVAATLGGESAELLFLGMTPGLVGLAQANVRVPFLPEGDHALLLTVGTASSLPALVAVRP